ncbi:hypothetical protein D7V77_41115, partial [Corallococcus sp. CA041A]|uniref:hypothetical protein n=1 Tax=Corallococcus sp. CA041A TaxID=2316727 RepID=UPI000EBE915D
ALEQSEHSLLLPLRREPTALRRPVLLLLLLHIHLARGRLFPQRGVSRNPGAEENERLPDDAELQRDLIRWLVQNAGPIETVREAPAVDDVFGVAEKHGIEVTTEAREEEPDFLHLIPGFEIAGRRWEFHLTDKDANRPAPHGHDIEDHSVVLDPYTGDVVDRDGKKLMSAKPKELRDLWRDKKFRRFADRARDTMREQQPWRIDALPPVPEP